MNQPSKGLMPDFLVIGAAKCGTTSLCDDLARHPGIFISEPKEIEYFCRDENYERGTGWYTSHFAGALPGQLRGEGSTHYTDHPAMPRAAERIASDLPGAKLVYMIRDPVRRAYSGWLQKIKNQDNFGGDMDVPRDFSRAVREYRPLVDCGDYQMQLGRYLEHFDRSRIHIMLFEEYLSDRQNEIDRLGAFLGFDPAQLTCMDPVWSNESSQHFDRKARTKLAQYLGAVPVIHRCRKAFPVAMRRKVLYALSHSTLTERFRRDAIPEPMSEQDRRWLWELYQPSIAWMEQFLGRELTIWRSPYGSCSATDATPHRSQFSSDRVGART